MKFNDYVLEMEHLKSWESKQALAKSFFQCPDDHEKEKTWLYKVCLFTGRNSAKDFMDLTCKECKRIKYNGLE